MYIYTCKCICVSRRIYTKLDNLKSSNLVSRSTSPWLTDFGVNARKGRCDTPLSSGTCLMSRGSRLTSDMCTCKTYIYIHMLMLCMCYQIRWLRARTMGTRASSRRVSANYLTLIIVASLAQVVIIPQCRNGSQ